jgi:hypothetical protein
VQPALVLARDSIARHDGRFAGPSAADEDRQQLGQSQLLRADGNETFARPVVLRRLADLRAE